MENIIAKVTVNWVTKNKWFRVHTPSFIDEIVSKQLNNNTMSSSWLSAIFIYLQRIAERAEELQDPILIAYMTALTMYTFSNPYHEDYDENLVKEILDAAGI